jgi:hypothetical protein
LGCKREETSGKEACVRMHRFLGERSKKRKRDEEEMGGGKKKKKKKRVGKVPREIWRRYAQRKGGM